MIQLPAEFEERMKQLLGGEYCRFAESYEKERAQGLRMNRLKGEREDFLRQFADFGLRPVPWAADGFYYDGETRPGKSPYHEAGAYYIQEPSAMSVVSLLDPRPGERVLDLCAAPGGKTSHAASLLGGTGLLVSNEIHPARARILSQNVERMGCRETAVTSASPAELIPYFPEYFDCMIVDAPCSGEGMFRKDEEARLQWSAENVRLCAERQQEILEAAASMLRPGGRLVYSTCTFAPEEDEQAVDRFLERHGEFSVVKDRTLPGLSAGHPEWSESGRPDLAGTHRIWPHLAEGEGHFLALLEKKAESPKESEEAGRGKKRGNRMKFPAYVKDKALLRGVREDVYKRQLQEYKNRKTYDVLHGGWRVKASQLGNEGDAAPKAETENGAGAAPIAAGTYLFTTKTCPNCKAAKEFLKDMDYQVIDAEENPELSSRFGVMQAPTLVLVKDGKIQKYVNASNIRRYTEEQKH